MLSKASNEEWIELSNGLSVSARRMRCADGKMFTLKTVADMDVDLFNTKFREYGVSISIEDPPIVRLMKYSAYLARAESRYKDSFIPTNEQYVDVAIDAAVADARGKRLLSSFFSEEFIYQQPGARPGSDATQDILEFRENIRSGRNKDKYLFTLLRFNKDFMLEPVEDIIVPNHDGHIWQLNPKHKYPSDVGSHTHFDIRPIEMSNLGYTTARVNVRGYFAVGKEPQKGEKRLVLHYPSQWSLDVSAINIDISKDWLYTDRENQVSALRLRSARPKD